MSLRLQTVLAFGGMLLVVLTVLFVVIEPMMTRTFARLEEADVRTHISRVENALMSEQNSMESTSEDWAAWDDTYAFAAGQMPSYVEDNVTVSSLMNLRMNVMLLTDAQGEALIAVEVDPEAEQLIPLRADLLDILAPSSLLAGVDLVEGQWVTGIVRTGSGLLLVAAHTILTSQYEGPSRGVLVFGRFLDRDEVDGLADQLDLSLTIRDVGDPLVDPSIVGDLSGENGGQERALVRATSQDTVVGYGLLRDLHGAAAGLITVTAARDMYLTGRATVRYLGYVMIGTLVGTMAVLLLMLDTRVLNRLSSAAAGVAAIAQHRTPSERVPVSGRDEIGRLEVGMNEMLATIEESTHKLQQSEKQYRDLFEYSRDAIYITSPDGRFIDVNQSLIDLLGCPREKLMELDAPSFYVDPQDREGFTRAIAGPGFVIDYPVRLKRCDGEILDCLLTTVAQRGPYGGLRAYQGIIRDITEVKRQQGELTYLATHDPLTGLLNRAALDDQLVIELARADRNLEQCGVMYLDLDRFKEVNDTYGHAAGDTIIRQAAQRLVGALRKSDSVARIGGDEFVILVPDLDRPRGAADVAEKILHVLQAPFTTSGQTLSLSASIGIAIFPDDSMEGKVLLRFADSAMYAAKQQGRNRWARHGGHAM